MRKKTEYITVTMTLVEAGKLAELLSIHRPDGFVVPSWAKKLINRMWLAAKMQLNDEVKE